MSIERVSLALAAALFLTSAPALAGTGDCDDNGVDDARQIAGGADDCNDNGVPDDCEPDCDLDGIVDDCDEDDCDPYDEVEELDCVEFDRFETLTPNDTLTLLTAFHNPDSTQGFAYVAAVNESKQPQGFDHLVGQYLRIDGLLAFEYGVNAVDYRAAVGQGELTDVDDDGHRDLNGTEYEQSAGEILVPRFLAQQDAVVPTLGFFGESELLLLGLSGGAHFDTTVDFVIYNDNEVPFSAEYTFRCWERVPLLHISGAFGQEFLSLWSGDDYHESIAGREAGWMRFDGAVASSTSTSIQDPAVYGVLIERVGSFAAADLPFERGARDGSLLPRAIEGDTDGGGTGGEPAAGEAIGGLRTQRKPGSLLIFPEFDNRDGVVSLFSVTNVSADDETGVHFVYLGRYRD